MKFMVLNSSGNAGKSLLSRELLYPRLLDTKIVEIETVNSGGSKFESLNILKFKGDGDFTDVYMEILENENIILDVGASNLTRFWESMSTFAGVETLFDYFIVPTSTRGKIQEDTFKTINFLHSEGIPTEKIKVVFNEVVASVKQDFEVLLSVDFPFDDNLYIKKNESLFNDLGFLKKTIFDIYNPDLDFYKPLFLKEKDGKEKLRLIKMDLANRQAQIVKERMDSVFESITGEKALWMGNEGEISKNKKDTAKKQNDLESGINSDDEEL